MSSKGAKPNAFAKLASAASHQVDDDSAREAASDRAREQAPVLLVDIQPSFLESLRPLVLEDVIELAVTIALFDLLQPIALDSKRRMIAGRRRRAACFAVCAVADPQRFQQHFRDLFPGRDAAEVDAALAPLLRDDDELRILPSAKAWYARSQGHIPARILPFDSAHAGDRARISEIIENERRKRFTAKEVQAAAQEFLKSGNYHNGVGRPKAGMMSLKNHLALVFDTSYGSVRRYLGEGDPAEKPAPRPAVVAKKRTSNLVKALGAYIADVKLSPERRQQLEQLLTELGPQESKVDAKGKPPASGPKGKGATKARK